MGACEALSVLLKLNADLDGVLLDLSWPDGFHLTADKMSFDWVAFERIVHARFGFEKCFAGLEELWIARPVRS